MIAAKNRFSHDRAHIITILLKIVIRTTIKPHTVFNRGIYIFSCIPDEKIQANTRFWSGLEILF